MTDDQKSQKPEPTPEPTPEPEPWAKRPGETRPCRAAFVCYLEQGPARSLRKTAELLKRDPVYKRILEKWSAKFEWVKRTDAYDESMIERGLRLRPLIREAALLKMADAAGEASDVILGVMRGDQGEGDTLPIMDRHGAVIGNRPAVAPSTRLQAAIRAHESIGLVPPKRVELTGKDGEALIRATETIAGVDDLTLSALRDTLEALEQAGEGDADGGTDNG